MAAGEASGYGPMDLRSDTIKITLHTSTYTPAQPTNRTKTAATNARTTGSYTARGQTLASKTHAQSSLTPTVDAADVTWTATSITHRIGVVCDDTPTTPADPLIMWVDNGGDVTTSSTDLVYQWNASGLWTFTVA